MLQVKISMVTKDGMGNEHTLNVSSDDWGVIKYRLIGRKDDDNEPPKHIYPF